MQSDRKWRHVSDKRQHVPCISASIIVCLAFSPPPWPCLYTTHPTSHIFQISESPCSTIFKAHTWLPQLTSLPTLSSISLHSAAFFALIGPIPGSLQNPAMAQMSAMVSLYSEACSSSVALSLIFCIRLHFLHQSGRHSHYRDHWIVRRWPNGMVSL